MEKRPYAFVGSSREGLNVAKAIQAELQYVAECELWSQGVFGLSGGTLESLVKGLAAFDFAILVLTPDDLVASRGDSRAAPRDNVLFELGLFIGGLGRERTFMVVDRSAALKLPSDLAGITPATFQPPGAGSMQAAVGPACTAIETEIVKLGGRQRGLRVRISGAFSMNVNRQQGVTFTVTNKGTKEIPPYKVAIFHPKLGTWSIFPSERSGALLPDQRREHRCAVMEGNRIIPYLPSFSADREGKTLEERDDLDFVFQLILEDSDRVLYENKRIARGFVRLIRKAVTEGKLGGTALDWGELNNALPDE